MGNVGMVLGIAIGGAELYAFSPLIMQKAVLEGGEAIMFPQDCSMPNTQEQS